MTSKIRKVTRDPGFWFFPRVCSLTLEDGTIVVPVDAALRDTLRYTFYDSEIIGKTAVTVTRHTRVPQYGAFGPRPVPMVDSTFEELISINL